MDVVVLWNDDIGVGGCGCIGVGGYIGVMDYYIGLLY